MTSWRENGVKEMVTTGGTRPEMESVDGYRVNEELPPEREEAVSFRYDPVALRTQGRETPPLVDGYLGRIGRERLLAREDEQPRRCPRW